MEAVLLVAPIFVVCALIGLYYENRKQTDALTRIAKVLEERNPAK